MRLKSSYGIIYLIVLGSVLGGVGLRIGSSGSSLTKHSGAEVIMEIKRFTEILDIFIGITIGVIVSSLVWLCIYMQIKPTVRIGW
jgi:hypothetical protein